jgi:hypothetical protein
LISQTGYSLLTEEGGQDYGGPRRVTVVCTLSATVVALLVCGFAAAAAPWIVSTMYGKGFAAAEMAATVAIATALLHMSAAPAAARLTVVSLKATGIINGIWTAVVIGLGSFIIPSGGAAEGTLAFFAAHLLSAVLVAGVLLRMGAAPRSLGLVSAPGAAGAVLLTVLGWARWHDPAHKLTLSVAILLSALVLVAASLAIARATGDISKGVIHRVGAIRRLQPQE